MAQTPQRDSAEACDIRASRTAARALWIIVLAGGAVMGLAIGVRHVQGLFLLPVTAAHGWSRELFGLAMAVQNLAWGLAQPFTGMAADRFGSGRVVAGGALLYALGLYGMAHAATPGIFVLMSGVLIGVALSGTSFGVVYAAINRLVPPDRRPWATGMAGAVAGLGQFAMVPAAQELIVALGWQGALLAMGALMAAALPLARPLRERAVSAAAMGASLRIPVQTMREAVREALAHRGFWLLNLGFLACGFQLAFIATHLPAYLIDSGLAPRTGVVALATIALANIAGIYACGVLGGRYRPKNLLALVYLLRTAAIALFLLLPLREATVYAFAAAMGLLWLGTVPLTTGVLARVFGVRYLATLFGFVFLGHQLGAFLGVWLGGAVFDATGSYRPIWLGAMALGLAAAALHWPIDDRPVRRPLTAAAA